MPLRAGLRSAKTMASASVDALSKTRSISLIPTNMLVVSGRTLAATSASGRIEMLLGADHLY